MDEWFAAALGFRVEAEDFMDCHEVIVIATPTVPPRPWQSGWEERRDDIPGLPGRLVISRATTGTPIRNPDVTRQLAPDWRPRPSHRQVAHVRAHLEEQVRS